MKQPRKFTARRRLEICYHEAGHAVANLMTGHDFIEIEIFDRPINNMGGIVRYDTSQSLPPFNQGVVSLAGPLSQIRHKQYNGARAMGVWIGDGLNDYNHAHECANDCINLKAQHHLDDRGVIELMEEKAKRIVSVKWDNIELVAQTLFAKWHLNYSEFLALLAIKERKI